MQPCLWWPGLRCVKAGIVPNRLELTGSRPQDTLFESVLRTLLGDGGAHALHRRYGVGVAQVGVAVTGPGKSKAWAMKWETKSPAFTTKWGERWRMKCGECSEIFYKTRFGGMLACWQSRKASGRSRHTAASGGISGPRTWLRPPIQRKLRPAVDFSVANSCDGDVNTATTPLIGPKTPAAGPTSV
jgi:hypothetical protein